MISERELRQVAGRAGLGAGQAEYEYVLLCTLDALSQTSSLAETFCLKGGTALRQCYFPDWRYSVDLDFSVLAGFLTEHLKPGLEAWFAQVGHFHGVQVQLQDFHKVDGAARVRARFVGPLRHPNRLLLDITLDEPVLLPPQHREVMTSLFTHPRPRVLIYALEEILAEKLRSILERGKARDYYDVWRLLKEKAEAFDWQTVRQVLSEKCRHKSLPQPTVHAFLNPTALDEAAMYWMQDLRGQVPGKSLPIWEAVITELSQLLTTFFS
ncbi:MAG: nucleotidyl transferase AbiEii/AbiGii toxin family protein [Candidatus Tectomicrobia bacterium]|nr:nucleotidyl transferase AbiEii/AbiGii toxin family protein [Candidatus Tectomicrobia bacterium]